jgi:hypothetical protein
MRAAGSDGGAARRRAVADRGDDMWDRDAIRVVGSAFVEVMADERSASWS